MLNVSWMEIRKSPTEDAGFYPDDLFPIQPKLEGPRVWVPDTHGIGIEVDESLIDKYPFQPKDFPHLRRRDGSVTNW